MRAGLLGRRALAGPLACLFALGLAACGGAGGGGAAGRILDFSAVEVGRVQLQVAPDGRSALLRVQTDPATVCAVSYGETAALGAIADDPAMGGGAITHHVVLLGGLTPNRSYRFRLTATDAHGRVYQTAALTSFATTVAPSASAYGRDIALGAKVVAVSSQWSSDYRAGNAFDGNLSSEWASAGDGNRAFVTIDLGRPTAIDGVAFRTREMSDGSAITRRFAVVADGRRRYGPFPAGNRLDPRITRVHFTARRLRFEVVSSSGGNTGAAEIEVFSPS